MRACRCFACRTYSHTKSHIINNKTADRGRGGGKKLKIKDLISKEFTSHTRDVLGNNNELLTFYMHNQFGSQTFEDGTTGAALAYQQSQIDFTQKVFATLDPIIELDFKEKENFNGSDIDIYSLYGYSEWDIDTIGEANKHGKGSNAYWDIYWRHGGVNNKTDIVNNTIVHEIGHVLGLSHPKERPYSKRWNDRETVMSYNKSGFTWNSWFTNLDIKTLQKIWGKENDHKDQLHEGKKNIANKLFGENGNDSLYGGKKSDTLKGGKGSDRLRGGAGNDKIHGGTGRDTAVFSARENQINLKSNKFQNSGDGHDLLISIENINAGGGNDVVTGNRSANTIKGQNGNDSLNGAPGHDYLIGGRGHDNLKGGSGNDKLIGGQGHDKLFGGSGRDTFVLTKALVATTSWTSTMAKTELHSWQA